MQRIIAITIFHRFRTCLGILAASTLHIQQRSGLHFLAALLTAAAVHVSIARCYVRFYTFV